MTSVVRTGNPTASQDGELLTQPEVFGGERLAVAQDRARPSGEEVGMLEHSPDMIPPSAPPCPPGFGTPIPR